MRNKIKDVYSTLPPELKLVLLCIRQQVTEKVQEDIYMLTAGPMDWDLFMHLTVRHRVYPLAYRYLSMCNHSVVPHKVINILRQKSRENMSKSLQMTGELVKVLRGMEDKGIHAVVLKGLPLAYKLYGNVAVRPSRDLDILVWPADVEKARKVLEEQGYNRKHPSFIETPARLRIWMKAQHHFAYWHQEKEIYVELHWRLGHQGVEIPLTAVKNSLTQVKIAGQLICVPKTEELLLFLVMHGAGHAWFRLRWICDIAMILRQEGFCWERLYGLAGRLGVTTLLNHAVILARNLLEATVPDNIAAAAEKDCKAQKWALMAIPFIFVVNFDFAHLRISMPMYYHYKRYEYSIKDGWRSKLAYLCSRFSPEERDIEQIVLPAYLYFIYYLIRPFTWFSRRVAQSLGR